MYGTQPSEPGQYAVDLFNREHLQEVLELGAGQGRDTISFLTAGFNVTAVGYESDSLLAVRERTESLGLADRLHATVHHVRTRLPYPDASFDAVYSHMLFNMALTTPEVDALAAEVRRVTRPSGVHVYTVRHVGDAHYRAGVSRGDAMYENGGFIVHSSTRHSSNGSRLVSPSSTSMTSPSPGFRGAGRTRPR
jgi:SAM-dependent methyltransferase